MSTGEQAHLGPPIGLELRVASPEGIRDTCTPWHCAGAARHIVPTQHLRYWAGVSFGRASGGAPHTVPVSFREVPCRSAALWAPVPRSLRGAARRKLAVPSPTLCLAGRRDKRRRRASPPGQGQRVVRRDGITFLGTDAHAALLDDPETALEGFPAEQSDGPRQRLQDVALVLTPQAEYHEAGIRLWGIGSYVREAPIEGDEGSRFIHACGRHCCISRPA